MAIEWLSNLDEALQLAKETKRPVLVDLWSAG